MRRRSQATEGEPKSVKIGLYALATCVGLVGRVFLVGNQGLAQRTVVGVVLVVAAIALVGLTRLRGLSRRSTSPRTSTSPANRALSNSSAATARRRWTKRASS